MSSLVKNRKRSVQIFYDISAFIIIVSIVLYLLFPKYKIENILNKELKHNNNLSIDYLKSMMQHSIHNMDLEKKLVEQYELKEEFEKALKVNRKFLKDSKNRQELNFLYRQEYLLLKGKYFKEVSASKKEDTQQFLVLKNKLQYLFDNAKREEECLFLLKESDSMNFQSLKYKALQALLAIGSSVANHNELEKEAFLLAWALNKNDEAHGYLSNILKRKNLPLEFQKQAFNFLIEHKYLSEAETFSVEFMKNEKNHEKKVENFKVAFYILAQDIENNSKKIEKLINLYKEGTHLDKTDLILLSGIYLQINKKEKAANLLYENFKKDKEIFDEKLYNKMIDIVSYAGQLPRALEIANRLYIRYPTFKNLDKRITFSTWLGKMDEVVGLNEEGWRKFKEEKYKAYLFKETSLDNSYKIQGEICKQEIESGDFTLVNKLKEYFEHTGEISKAETYFHKLLKRYPEEKSILKEAIRFSHYNSHYKEAQKLYVEYRENYGMDKELHRKMVKESLALKDLNSAYLFAKEVGLVKVKTKSKTEHSHLNYVSATPEELHNMRLREMAWIEKDYDYVYKLLWKEEELFTKDKNSYDRLILLEKNLRSEARLEYLYSKAWRVTNKKRYLFSLLSLYIDKKMYTKFNDTVLSLNEEDRILLEKEANYHILMANYYVAVEQKSRALESFKKALSLDDKNSDIHSVYIWFLVDNSFNEELEEELKLLRLSSMLQREIAFPSIVAALKLDKSDLALKWIKPILKENRKKKEYLLLYADILDLQNRTLEAKRVRSQLFRILNSEVKFNPTLLKNKEFARVYLQMALLYKGSYIKKMSYIKEFKSLFSAEEYMDIKLGWYVYVDNHSKVEELLSQYKDMFPKKDIASWVQLYLAEKSKDKESQKRFLQKSKNLSLKDKIFLARNLGDREEAYRLLFEGMDYNRNDMKLLNIYWDMVNEDYPKNSLKSSIEQLSKNISLVNLEFGKKIDIDNNLNLEFNVKQDNFFIKNKKDNLENSLSLSLSNKDNDFLWRIKGGKTFGDDDFYHAEASLKYRMENTIFGVEARYHNKTTLTSKLQLYALENSVGFNGEYKLSNSNNIGVSYKRSDYSLKSGAYLGESDTLHIYNNYLLRNGYPDVSIYSYIGINSYRFIESNIGLKSFNEIGTELSIGKTSQNSLQKTLKPYISMGTVVTDDNQVGSNFTVGGSMMLFGMDKLDISLNYLKGVNNLNEELSGINVEYKF